MLKYILIFTLFFYSTITQAQEKYTISGYVKDAATGEVLIGTNIYIKKLETGTITNNYGFYSLTIPEGEYIIVYRYVGYKPQELKLYINQKIKQNIELSPNAIEFQTVEVTGEAIDKNVKSSEMSAIQISPMEIQTVPILFGEQDILKTIQLIPGVKSVGEGNSGFYVRGGSADQNLILLDEAPVYNASHLIGFFSVFNSDAIKDVKLIKGAAPSEYGGRLSSVLDLKMNEGNSKEFDISGGIGLISSRLTLQGPIVKDEGSFIISARRTYIDLFLGLSSDEKIKNTKFYFYDLNMKANYRLGENDRIYLSGYLGRDVLGMNESFDNNWGNTTLTLRWNHLFSDKLFLNTSLIYSNYDYEIKFGNSDNVPDISAAIQDYNLKTDFQYFINTKNNLRFGFNSIYHTFKSGKVAASTENAVNYTEIPNKYALENAVYLSHELDVTQRLKINYGLRYSIFTVLGPGNVYTFDEDGETIDTKTYTRGEIIKNYSGLEPRLTANYLLDDKSSLKLSYARNTQYIHLLSNSTSSTPLDLWHPSSSNLKPGISDQAALGYFRNFDNGNYETSVEVYYKDLKNQVDYKNGAEILMNEKVESQLVFGKGWAYGIEFFIKKKFGKLNGWIGYTWSKTERQFDNINNGRVFPARQDRTHDISIVGIYKPNKTWAFSATWVYNTGNAVTFPSGKYIIEGNTANLYTERNGYRMPDYHRLDLGVTYNFSEKSSLNFSLYNAYSRKNAYTITFWENENDPTKTEAVRIALFSIVPSITYNFKF